MPDLQACKDECHTKFVECKYGASTDTTTLSEAGEELDLSGSGDYDYDYDATSVTGAGRRCKKTKKVCKRKCDAATLCAPCEDNDIDGLGTEWCVTNSASETFCDVNPRAKKFCKKTCDLCD